VKLDGTVVDAVYVDSPRLRGFPVLLVAPPGDHVLGLEFLNDRTRGKEDRNLWIDSVVLQH
jgi:hypothetical protein